MDYLRAQIVLSLVDKVTQPLHDINKSIRTFNEATATFTKLGTKMMITGSAAIFVGKSFVSAAGQIETYRATLTNMFAGDVDKAKARLKELSQIAATTPFELPQVIEAGNQLQAIGKYSADTLKALGDMAANAGKPIEQALRAYTKLATGQKGIAVDMFRDLLITTEDWINATGKGVSKSGELLATTEEMLAALPKILASKNILGAMEAQSKTFSGVISNFKDSMFQFFATFGEGLLDPVKSVIKGITDVINSIKQWGEEHPKLASFISRFVGIIAVLSVTLGLLLVLYSNWSKITRIMQINTLLLSKCLSLLNVQLLKTAAAMLTNPISWIVIGIIALIAIIVLLVKHWDKLKTTFMNIAKPVIEQFNRLKNNLKTLFEPLFNLLAPVKGLFKPIIDMFSNISFTWQDFLYWVGFGVGVLSALFGFLISNSLAGALATLNAFLEGWLVGIKQIWQGFTNIFEGIKKIFSGDIVGGLIQIGKGILQVIIAPIVAIINIVIGLINNVIGLINKINIKVPDWVPLIGGKTIAFNIPKIPPFVPSFATGVENFSGGLAYVHKDELVALPKGSSVFTKKETRELLRTQGETIIKNYSIGKIEINPDTIDRLRKIVNLFDELEAVCL